MAPRKKWLVIILVCGFGVILTATLVLKLFVQIQPVQGTASPVPSNVPAPGLVVSGYVRSVDGTGIENVEIHRSYASYPGIVIATTDAGGFYESGFYPIPGDEMVAVWAEKPGLIFEPEFCSWRHYHGYEKRSCDFSAQLP